MFNIGDKVVYTTLGVMEIADIADQTIGDVTKKYYVMRELFGNSSSLTYVPVDNEGLVSQMRELLTKKDIEEILKRTSELENPEWIEDNRARSNEYKKIISSGDYASMLRMINSVYETGKRRVEEGKKNYLADEASMKKAEKLIYSEFSLVLGIDEADVPKYIEDRVK